jgi:hypothetical protein
MILPTHPYLNTVLFALYRLLIFAILLLHQLPVRNKCSSLMGRFAAMRSMLLIPLLMVRYQLFVVNNLLNIFVSTSLLTHLLDSRFQLPLLHAATPTLEPDHSIMDVIMSTCATHPSLSRPQSLHLHLQLARNANGTSLRVTATQFAAMDTLSLPAPPFMEVCLIAAMPLSPPVITKMFVPLLLRHTTPQRQVLSAALPLCPRRLRDHRP